MEHFLEKIAQEIYQNYQKNLAELYVVLPSRRSCLYMKHFLSKIIDKNIFLPQIFSMDDFIAHIADVQIPDQVHLLFQLYNTYKYFDTKPEHDLEKFAPLGSLILKDFDAIDKYLVPQNQLFEYLKDVKAIERWGENLGKEIPSNTSIFAYYEFWQHLKDTFFAFRQKLLDRGQAYSGLAYRRIAENLDDIVFKNEIDFIVFAGFNQLSTSETAIIQKLENRKKAKIYFDADKLYVENKIHEAGFYFKKYKKNWLAKIDFLEENITQNPKNIEIIGVANRVSQAKVAGDILKNIMVQKDNTEKLYFKQQLNDTAILLPDESMLMPLLHALPIDKRHQEDLGMNLKDYVNVTMGLSIDKTPLFYLIDNLFTLQKNIQYDKQNNILFYYKDVINILKHPFIQYSKKYNTDYEQIQEHIKKIQEKNLIYIPSNTLLEWGNSMKYYKIIFRFWKNNPFEAIAIMQNLVAELSELFHEESNILENEYLYKFYLVLNQLEVELKNYEDEILNLSTFRYFLYEILRSESIPFTGEPLSSIQIMGLLESRALDFKNIIILSCNEGVLPKGKSFNSLIPHDVRGVFHLPSYSETDATMAYTFYRLFHKAQNIFLIYSNANSFTGKGEKSRFLTQVESELKNINHIKISQSYLSLDLPNEEQFNICIHKEEKIVRKAEQYLKQGITPSYVNMYLRNPLEFFCRKILLLKTDKAIEEHFLTNTFGTIIHEFLERNLKVFIGKELKSEDLEKIWKNDKKIQQEIEQIAKDEKGGIVLETGKNYLLKNIALYLVKNFLKEQQKECPYRLINQENTLEWNLPININNEILQVKLSGKTDRIDFSKGVLRVVDYKTGNYLQSDLKAESLEELLTNPEKHKIVQLLLYKYLFIRNLQSDKIQNLPEKLNLDMCFYDHKNYIKSGFYFFRKISDGFVAYQIDDEPKDLEGFLGYVEEFMHKVVGDILNTERLFSEQLSDFDLEILH